MWAVLVVVVAIVIALYCEFTPRGNGIPPHVTNYPAFGQDNLIPEDIAKDLQELIRELREFPSNVDQTKAAGFQPKYEEIGEGVPIDPITGTCAHKLLFPNANRTRCILPARVDIGKHYVMTGGLDGKKENIEDSIDRVSSFGKYTFISDIEKYPSVKALFHGDDFQSAAKKVCPAGKNYLDTFQFNFIMQVPGQTVAAHLDAPYFWGANRFHFPQWLLVVMVYSNLFIEKFVDQIQVVGYLHDWGAKSSKDGFNRQSGGEFVYYHDANTIGTISPIYRSGSFIDGSKMIHAAKIYRPDVKAPKMLKDEFCALRYLQDDDWEVQCDRTDQATGTIHTETKGKYKSHDLRISIVYRARCFTTEEESKQYVATNSIGNYHETMDLESDILDKLKQDLIQRQLVSKTRTELDTMNRLDLAFLLMDTYIKYPLPPKELAWFPYNYCAVPLVLPWTAPLFKFIC